MDCEFSPSSPHLLPNRIFSPQNRISFELFALSGLSGFSTFNGGKVLIFQGFANSRSVREFLLFSFKVRIVTLTRNQFARKRTWVRIPPSPLLKKPCKFSVCKAFSYSMRAERFFECASRAGAFSQPPPFPSPGPASSAPLPTGKRRPARSLPVRAEQR